MSSDNLGQSLLMLALSIAILMMVLGSVGAPYLYYIEWIARFVVAGLALGGMWIGLKEKQETSPQ